MADRIAILNEGRIEQVGTPSEVYYNPISRFVTDFIGESNFLEVTDASGGCAALADGTRVPCRAEARSRPATLVVRPESIHVAGDADAPEGSLRGRVAQTSFLGSYTRVAVRCAASPVPVIAALYGRDRAAAERLAPEQEVALWWEADDAVLLDREEHQPKEETE